ncbi:MAG: hypothetical protein CSA11_11440 [Chloroflexi bacterium]|nr:MAG: hypothetical protein CSA11_11440 [Chloroflexota bacterium]
MSPEWMAVITKRSRVEKDFTLAEDYARTELPADFANAIQFYPEKKLANNRAKSLEPKASQLNVELVFPLMQNFL